MAAALEKLSEAEVQTVRLMIQEHGLARTSEELVLAQHTTAKIGLGEPVTRLTASHVRTQLLKL